MDYVNCKLCPRMCGVDRPKFFGGIFKHRLLGKPEGKIWEMKLLKL